MLRLLLGAVNFLRKIDTKSRLAVEHQLRRSHARPRSRPSPQRRATHGALCGQLKLEHLALARAALSCNMPLTALRNVEMYCEKVLCDLHLPLLHFVRILLTHFFLLAPPNIFLTHRTTILTALRSSRPLAPGLSAARSACRHQFCLHF